MNSVDVATSQSALPSAALAVARPPPRQNHAESFIIVDVRQETSWDHLIVEIEAIKAELQLSAYWHAYVGNEAYGVWILYPDDRASDQIRARFTLFAARAIEMAGIRPISLPEPLQHCPQWKDYCRAEEAAALLTGNERDFAAAVPFGLANVDRDAVDPCTRAWLEELRRESRSPIIKGRSRIGDTECETLGLRIEDLCGESAAYCRRRVREDIRDRLEGTKSLSVDNSGKSGSLKTQRRRGRRPNLARRVAIESAIKKHGENWREHLDEVFTELDASGVALGDLEGMTIDLGDGQGTRVAKWGDLALADGDQLRQIVDRLRKYVA